MNLLLFDKVRKYIWLVLLGPAMVFAEEARQDSARRDERLLAPRKAFQTTVDRGRWLARRRQFTFIGVNYGLTGLPIMYFNPNRQWRVGGRLHLTDYSRLPFRYKMILGWSKEAGEKASYFARVRVPHIGNTGWGLRAQANFSRGGRRYYGIGNSSEYDGRFVDPHSPLFRDERYYHYILDRSRVFVGLLRDIRPPLLVSIGLGLNRSEIGQVGGTSLIFEERPPGIEGGESRFISLILSWDTRDYEALPRKGTLHEWSYETAISSPAFRRYTFTDIRYLSLNTRLKLANRAVFEVLHGTVPIGSYGEMGSSKRVVGLGGNNSLRGFDSQRFIDDVRFVSNSELRYRLHNHTVFRQYLEWHAILFMDYGRVWSDLQDLELDDMHLTRGGGLRAYWDEDFVVRLEVGFSSEQTTVGLLLGNIF